MHVYCILEDVCCRRFGNYEVVRLHWRATAKYPTERRARDGQAIPEETGKTGSPAAILRSLPQAGVVVSLFGRGLCEASSERLAASRGSRFSSL